MPELLLLILLVILTGFPVVADVFDEAQWLRDPVFESVEIIDLYHKDKAPKPKLSGPRNVHTLFRREIDLVQKPAAALLRVTGDDYYKLYINGQFVVQGPESGYPFAHPYYEIDVAPFLVAGRNSLAAHAYYQGLLNRVWNSADNRSGFILSLDVTYEDGSTVRCVTDGQWRCFPLAAFPTGRTIGYETQFAEDIDMAAIPLGWREAEFDDSAWGAPLEGRQDHVFVQQITPPLQMYRVDPVRVKDKGDGNYFYEFQTELVGHTRIHIQGPAGHKLEVRHGEELSAPDTVRYEMRCNCTYQEFPILSGRDEVIEFYDYRGFRYIEILDAPVAPEVWVDVRHHPFPANTTQITASDDLLPRLWYLCKNGVRFGAQGGFLDCPTREKGQYLGDALISAHAHLLLTGDASLTKKALHDFQLSQRICPGIMAVAPGSFMQEIAEYSLQWPLLLREYYRYTGDRVFTESMANAAFDGLFDYFARFESDAGLITGMKEKWVLVDWPKNLRDDYDYDYAETRENTVLNAFYYASLEAASELLQAFGRDASAYEAKATRVKQAFAERLLDSATGLFLDAPGSTHSSLHANAIPLRFGLVAPDNVPKVLDLIREKRLSCGVYIAPFVIEACFRAGAPGLGYDLLTSKDEHSWYEMLAQGATACLEAWGPDQKWNTSWCHPWSSSPIYLLTEQVMGLTPARPGWREVRFAPRIPESLGRFDLTIPTPQGPIAAQYTRDNGYALTVPPGVMVHTDVTDGVQVSVNCPDALTPEQQALLEAQGWKQYAGTMASIWVSIPEQRLRLIEGGRIVWQAKCSTSAKGPGFEMGSFKTPLGWHAVATKIGANAPWGQVFRSRKATEEIWLPGQETDEDLVLTRMLTLDGLEPGKNKNGQVDSNARDIYIHGTNGEDRIGTPASHGCIRLTNDDVVDLFDRVPEGTRVLITN